MSVQREKFSTQMDARLLAQLRRLAKSEGRQLQSLIEEAVEQMLADHNSGKIRPEIIEAFEESVRRFPKTYETLAK